MGRRWPAQTAVTGACLTTPNQSGFHPIALAVLLAHHPLQRRASALGEISGNTYFVNSMNTILPNTGLHPRFQSANAETIAAIRKWLLSIHELFLRSGFELPRGNARRAMTSDRTQTDLPSNQEREQAGSISAPTPSCPESNGRDPHLLVIIGQSKSRVFRLEANGGTPIQLFPGKAETPPVNERAANTPIEAIQPDSPSGSFGLVAKTLETPGHILLFGTKHGPGSEIDPFLKWIAVHHPDLLPRIIGSVVTDRDRISEGQILKKAEEFYADLRRTDS